MSFGTGSRLALIGYGEVGRILAEDLRKANRSVTAYDVKLESGAGDKMRAHAKAIGVRLATSHAEAVAGSHLVISVVTASQTLAAAESCLAGLPAGCFFLDLNSASPGTKCAVAEKVEAIGGRFVEGAVMTSVPPYRIKVPLLIGGPHATEIEPMLRELGFVAEMASEKLGVASATKMCRSVMIKGLEAMVVEAFTSARHYGVEDAVIASLRETFPAIDWEKQATYFFQRTIEHGRRRGEEMCEAAETVREAGLVPLSASATATRQTWMADLASLGVFGELGAPGFARGADWRIEADRILKQKITVKSEPTQATLTLSAEEKTPGWLDWCAQPSKPRFTPPPGAVDAHCHVFGPAGEFPFAKERKYTPCDASKAQLFALRDQLGFARNVIVQATCHGTDNSAMVDACRASGGLARGVASVRRDISDRELMDLHDAGVRGVRFNFIKRLVDFTPREELLEIATRVHPLGWHVVVYFEACDLAELWDFFTALPTKVVVDHMGRPDVTKGITSPEFELFLRFMRENENVWTKVSCPERLSVNGLPAVNGETSPYGDVVPFACRVVENFPDRVLWGTDWPHPNLKNHMPDDGLLVDIIPRIAVTRELQDALLVANPMRLYWPEEME